MRMPCMESDARSDADVFAGCGCHCAVRPSIAGELYRAQGEKSRKSNFSITLFEFGVNQAVTFSNWKSSRFLCSEFCASANNAGGDLIHSDFKMGDAYSD